MLKCFLARADGHEVRRLFPFEIWRWSRLPAWRIPSKLNRLDSTLSSSSSPMVSSSNSLDFPNIGQKRCTTQYRPTTHRKSGDPETLTLAETHSKHVSSAALVWCSFHHCHCFHPLLSLTFSLRWKQITLKSVKTHTGVKKSKSHETCTLFANVQDPGPFARNQHINARRDRGFGELLGLVA